MNLTGSLIELAEGTCLPDAERESPAVRAVTQAANMLVTIGNDLFSLHRETEHDVLESNVVSGLQHERDRTTEQTPETAARSGYPPSRNYPGTPPDGPGCGRIQSVSGVPVSQSRGSSGRVCSTSGMPVAGRLTAKRVPGRPSGRSDTAIRP